MSSRFSIIPARALEDPEIGNAALRVLCVLGVHSDKGGWCYPSISGIANQTGITRQAVQNQIAALVSAGILEKKTRHRPNGSQTTNLYRILFDVGEPEEEVAPSEETDDQVAPPATPRLHPRNPQVAPSRNPQVAPITSHRTTHKNLSSPDGETPVAERPRNPHWDALVEGVGTEVRSTQDQKRVGKIVSQLKQAEYTPEEIALACRTHKKQWPGITITWESIGKNISTLLATAEKKDERPAWMRTN